MSEIYAGPTDRVEEEWEDLPEGGHGKITRHYYRGELVRQDYEVILPQSFMTAVAEL